MHSQNERNSKNPNRNLSNNCFYFMERNKRNDGKELKELFLYYGKEYYNKREDLGHLKCDTAQMKNCDLIDQDHQVQNIIATKIIFSFQFNYINFFGSIGKKNNKMHFTKMICNRLTYITVRSPSFTMIPVMVVITFKKISFSLLLNISKHILCSL